MNKGQGHRGCMDALQRLQIKLNATLGQFHKTINDVFSSQKDRFINIMKLTKFSLFGVNLRS